MPKEETAEEIKLRGRTIYMTDELWGQIEPVLVQLDTDFSKFARNAIRAALAQLAEQSAQTKGRR